MTKDALYKYLPHRDDMLLLDSCANIDGKAHAVYTIKGDEFFLKGHFPGNPVVPGVILCEIMAQACCVLLYSGQSQDSVAYFSGIKEAKFKGIVRPNDKLDIQSEIVRKVSNFYFAKGQITVHDKIVATAEFSFAVVDK